VHPSPDGSRKFFEEDLLEIGTETGTERTQPEGGVWLLRIYR
jgi:hypothetical protein